MSSADLLNALPDAVLVKVWATSPTSKEVRELMGISQNTLLKWQSEGNSEQIGRIATAIRKAYGGVPDAPKENPVSLSPLGDEILSNYVSDYVSEPEVLLD